MFKNQSKKLFLFIFIALVVILVMAGLGCKKTTPTPTPGPTPGPTPQPSANLSFWGLWDDSSVFQPLIDEYRKINPNVTVTYKKWEYSEYEDMVTESLAAGRGPDIWMIHNTWLEKHKEKLSPMPDSLKVLPDFEKNFVDVVADDFVDKSEIYGVALSVDTLALYWNEDLLKSAHYTSPPQNWEEFKEYTEKLTKFDEMGNIIQSGAALGCARNVNRTADILGLLMLQNGTQMINEERTQATFNQEVTEQTGEGFNPGKEALIFYTDFANPKKKVYTWNPTLSHSIDAFIDEKVALMFSYSYHRPTIEARAPKLNYSIAPVPQIEGTPKEVNFANYWGIVVSNQSQAKEVAWDFLKFLSSKDMVAKYCEATGRPASRYDVIEEQQQDPKLSVFANQTLTAKSWFRGKNLSQTEGIIIDMIEKVVLGEQKAEEAIDWAAAQVTTLLQ